MNWLNSICREILDGWRETDREGELFFHNYFKVQNPDYAKDVHRRAMVGVVWEMLACVAIIGFMGGLAYLRSTV